jgi:hypothetical protein
MTTLPAETGSFPPAAGAPRRNMRSVPLLQRFMQQNGIIKMNPASENSLREHVERRIRRMLKIDALSLHIDSTPAEFIKVLHFPG